MKLVLQATHSALLLADAIGRATLRIRPGKNQYLASIFTHTFETNMKGGATFPVHITREEKGKRAYIEEVGELPESVVKAHKEVGMQEGQFLLQNKGTHEAAFGLEIFGLGAELVIDEVTDEELQRALQVDHDRDWQGHQANAIGVAKGEPVETEDSPFRNGDVDFTLDARYFLAVKDLLEQGTPCYFMDREKEQPVKTADIPERSYSPFVTLYDGVGSRFLPLFDQKTAEYAQTYYEVVPQKYLPYTQAIALTQLNAHLIDPEDTFDIVFATGDARFDFGVTYRAFMESDGHDGLNIVVSDGEQLIKISDVNFASTLHTPLFIVDETQHAKLAKYGYAPENVLDYLCGLKA